ncbi:MAG: ribonuclease D [Alphaproteobacteria bacterium]
MTSEPQIFVYDGDLPDDLILAQGAIAVDTETMGLDLNRDRLCVVQLCVGDGNAHLVRFEPGQYNCPNLKKLLSDKSRLKLYHFARFDVASIYKYLGIWATPLYCTKIASRLVRTYTDRHGLKDLCRELLGVQISKQQQSSYWGNTALSGEQAEYAAGDVLYLHDIKEKLDMMLKRENRTHLAQKCFEFMPTRVELDLAGWNDTDILAHS